MSFKQVLFASGTAISLIVPITDASAQYRNYDRPAADQQRQQRPAQAVRPQHAGRPQQIMQRPQPQRADIRSNTKPVAPANKGPVEQQAKPAPVAPLTEEQIAAKAAVDELLARDPALIAARQTPDPALARAAAARHNAQEAKLAALKAQQEVEVAKRREIEEKNKAREDAKATALKAKQDAQAKNAKPKDELTRNKPALTTASVSQAPSALVRPVPRMPAPEGPPMARNL